MHGRYDRLAGFNSRAGRSFSEPPAASSAYFDRDRIDCFGVEDVTIETQGFGDDIRRHPDGSIEFNSYRSLAIALRRQAMRDPVDPRALGAAMLVWFIVVAVVFLADAEPSPAPQLRIAPPHTYATPVR